MEDRDWTGTAAAVTALALSAGVWLWPTQDSRTAPQAPPLAEDQDDLSRLRAEARRWDGRDDTAPTQVSSTPMVPGLNR